MQYYADDMGWLKLRHRLYLLSFALCCLANSAVCAAQARPADSAENLFDFHSGFWINLHHFLYWQALSSEPPKGSHSITLNKSDSEELQRLGSKELSIWNAAVSYYATSQIKRDLLFDGEMEASKNQLEDAENSPDLIEAQIPVELKNMLLAAAPIYKKH
jgi:hypothetical protein